jgi:hypothetical protein
MVLEPSTVARLLEFWDNSRAGRSKGVRGGASEGKAEEALQSAVCNASQTLALGLGFGRFESWRETHETCKMQMMQRATRVKARSVSRLAGDGGQILYLCIRGQAVQVLAAVTKLFWRLRCLFGTQHHTSPGL